MGSAAAPGAPTPDLLPTRLKMLPSAPRAAVAGFFHLADRPHPRQHPPGASWGLEREVKILVKISGMADAGAAKALPSAAAMRSPVGSSAPQFFAMTLNFYFSAPQSGLAAPQSGPAAPQVGSWADFRGEPRHERVSAHACDEKVEPLGPLVCESIT